MKTLLTITTLALVLAGCASAPPATPPAYAGKFRNACLPEAAGMAEGLKKEGIQAEALIINTTRYSHAVCIYLYPSGANQLWAWDENWKSLRLRAYYDDADGIGRAWLAQCFSGQGEQFVSAEILN